MVLKISNKKATAVVSKQMKEGKTVVSEDQHEEPVPGVDGSELIKGPVCEVGVEASYTHNLGNYQSARVQVSLKIQCSHPEINSVYDYAREWVDTRMAQLQEELES